jgi:hypothetical protein
MDDTVVILPQAGGTRQIIEYWLPPGWVVIRQQDTIFMIRNGQVETMTVQEAAEIVNHVLSSFRRG